MLSNVVKTLSSGYNTYNSLTNVNFYYYFAGESLGTFLTSLFFFINFYADIIDATPVPQWARYAPDNWNN